MKYIEMGGVIKKYENKKIFRKEGEKIR